MSAPVAARAAGGSRPGHRAADGPSGADDPSVASAARDALEAEQRSGVTVRVLHEFAALQEVQALFEVIWRPEPGGEPVTAKMMRALTEAGSYVAGAYADGVLVGACVGFFAAPTSRSLHSHVAGVAATSQARSVGRTLKVHQRAWALEHGVEQITWTMDPLVARNAWFNVSRLGAVPADYLPNFYGPMLDAVNGDDSSDRLLMAWDLRGERVAEALAGHPPVPPPGSGVLPVLRADAAGRPVLALPDRPGAPRWRVAVPGDVEALRRSDPDTARAWRSAVRTVLGGAMAAGARVVAVARDGAYLLEGCEHLSAADLIVEETS